MKRHLIIAALFGFLFSLSCIPVLGQEDSLNQVNEGQVASPEESSPDQALAEEETVEVQDENFEDMEFSDGMGEESSFHQRIKDKFIEGGATFMWPILLCLILGLAVSIERIITLNLSTTNTKKLLNHLEKALVQGGIDAAKSVTKNTKGPVASIFTQGLIRSGEGIEMVEKSVISYGGVEMGRLERGLIWISLFISLGPMLGFFGTVVGMIAAFDAIEAAGDISPQVVAGGMKTALLTTVGGLIVGMILQVFYNYLISKIDSLVNDMEDASISFVDILVKHKIIKAQ